MAKKIIKRQDKKNEEEKEVVKKPDLTYKQNLTEQFKSSFGEEPFTVVPSLGMAFSIGKGKED